MRLVDAERIEQADRIGRHVVQEIGCLDLLPFHGRLQRAGNVGHAPLAEVGGEAAVAIVEADDVEAARRQALEQRVRPDGELRAQAHHQQQRRIALVAGGLVFDLDAVRLDLGHTVLRVHHRERVASAWASQLTEPTAAATAASFEA